MKRILVVLILIIIGASFGACELPSDLLSGNDPSAKSWALVEESAESSEVTIALDHANEIVVAWMKDDFTRHMKDAFDVKLVIVEEDFETIKEIVSNDLAMETESGRYDMLLVEGNRFIEFLENDLLYGPFLESIPNAKTLVDLDSVEFKFYEGFLNEGYLSPIGRQQLSMIYNQDVFYEAPQDYDEMLDYLKEYRNSFVYPDPRTTIEGEYFITGVASRDINLEKLIAAKSKEEVLELIGSNMELLNDFEPYMYEKGRYYPKSIGEVDELFTEEELIFSMSMSYDHATEKAQSYEFPEGAASFVFDSGTTGNVEWIGIVANAPNKSGAMVVVNELISPDIQASRYDNDHGGYLPVYEPGFTPDEAFEPIKSKRLRSTSLKYDALLSSRIGVIPASVRKIIVEIWEEQVLDLPTEE